MQVPSILQGESLKRLLQGAAVGAVATIFVGFSWGGWSLGSTADRMAKDQSERAVVAALAPVCADKFRALPDAEAKTIALSKIEAWKRGEEFPKDFVTLPGETYPSSALVYACATLLLAPKSASLQWEAVRNRLHEQWTARARLRRAVARVIAAGGVISASLVVQVFE
jgi:hypothetical protein